MENEEVKKFIFEGFDTPNTTPVPDQLFDVLLSQISGHELKVVLYIIRRTYGFKKDSDNISLSQMLTGITKRDGSKLDYGAGLSKPTLLRALKSLIESHVIVAERRESKEKGHEPTNYRLNVRPFTPLGSNFYQGKAQIFTKPLVHPLTTQQTVRQQTDIKNNVNVGVIKNKNENDLLENERATILVSDLMEQLNDRNPRSKATFRKIITALGTDKVYRLLGNTKEAYRDGLVSGSKMAGYFIGMAKNVAKEIGVDLGFKTENGRPTNGSQQYPINGLVAELANLKSGFRNKARGSTVPNSVD